MHLRIVCFVLVSMQKDTNHKSNLEKRYHKMIIEKVQ